MGMQRVDAHSLVRVPECLPALASLTAGLFTHSVRGCGLRGRWCWEYKECRILQRAHINWRSWKTMACGLVLAFRNAALLKCCFLHCWTVTPIHLPIVDSSLCPTTAELKTDNRLHTAHKPKIRTVWLLRNMCNPALQKYVQSSSSEICVRTPALVD